MTRYDFDFYWALSGLGVMLVAASMLGLVVLLPGPETTLTKSDRLPVACLDGGKA
ncbi:hypothetical protein [Roseibium sp. RKSG952]|uniref:hypothetical protein n=1 Tax=Roseibium sp. RKSG952 TaxID=2529384 RepID=UPI0012BD3AF7|nr:hypothetical protein [Roseibium sp. RKSG952]